MRKGNLTDAQTLRLYNGGESLITLAIYEGMSVYGVSHRLRRARKSLGLMGKHRKPSKLPVIDSVAELSAQLQHLTGLVEALSRGRK